MTSQAPDTSSGRLGQVAFVAVLAVAGLGYLVGIDYGVPSGTPGTSTIPEHVAKAGSESAVMPSTSYSDLRNERIGANADFRSELSEMSPMTLPPTTPPDATEKRQSLTDRASRRAYNGAPPVIPHGVEQTSSDGCPACHESAIALDGKQASRLPHPYLANCQQCHVAASPLSDTEVFIETGFRGLPAPLQGERAWAGAPPTIPHSSWMRDECLSCHGVHGKPGMRTTHPERVNCLQCHGLSAALDQVAFAHE